MARDRAKTNQRVFHHFRRRSSRLAPDFRCVAVSWAVLGRIIHALQGRRCQLPCSSTTRLRGSLMTSRLINGFVLARLHRSCSVERRGQRPLSLREVRALVTEKRASQGFIGSLVEMTEVRQLLTITANNQWSCHSIARLPLTGIFCGSVIHLLQEVLL